MSEDFFHPSETQILKEILKCAEIHQKVQTFIVKHSVIATNDKVNVDDNDMPKGLYLSALAHSIESALNPFRNRMLALEKEHIKNGNLPINFFLTEIKEFQTFFHFLAQFINEVKSQKLHGCAILSLLHKYNHHADPKSMQALKTIRLGVYAVFLRQLTQWLIYGRLVDAYGEFFIIHDNTISKSTDTMVTTVNTLLSERASTKSELWKFQISYAMIPTNFTTSWAENVLFIGQTVRMLVDDPRKTVKKNSIWNDEDEVAVEFGSLWNKQEHMFFNKIQKLYNCNSIDNGSYEHVVNEIKLFVTERLSEIAFNQADLIKHLRFFRDYYLLGRGELFLEFITQLKSIETRSSITENLAREINQAFQKALSRTSNDMDQITAYLLVEDIDFSNSEDSMQTILNGIRLNFHVRWPLHLFFSPRVLHQYNELFVFLLQIRQLQNELHSVWCLHRDIKIAGNSMISQLRNKMLFLIDNLQYYLQVDVIESQFCTLIGAVQNSKDFELIQRAHNVFQANVMCLSFLLNTGTTESSVNDSSEITSPADKPENPVRKILNKIFKTIRVFCNINEAIEEQQLSAETQQILNIFEEQ